MLDRQDSRTDLGIIRIHKNAIASITSIAASEIEGVSFLGESFRFSWWLLLRKKKACSIRVEIDKNQELKITIPLVVKYGFNIPDIASSVQENVRQALENSTNLTLKDIDIVVKGVKKD
ncbi:MAG: Asp23/Gls24 family envelope stress response protein [Candidatus Omnitrophota bacterium]|nr:Asp23/Gls24 family envelope stress response protein [Candidatus Omnitrophota bacterium]MBU1929111.1 Asp23/Gls24 family envelope stress response protein [Candidatus Omnitrophota bacterium]MBU1929138.1 Asp23/Gls24 family envelope stress response protein [Candidatus Omnitrophota bacterium]MBU2035018.1 Asp23/Gls24 family envelope stress response protein [Candidatus Omnitrophota bacterium]MBU2222018.1 Asp23/Gls24 family envelope stress response protein [Candidatus Omnitrophota bacterium]